MAENEEGQGEGGTAVLDPPETTPTEPSGPTKRVVLKQERALVVPEGIDEGKLAEAVAALGRGSKVKLLWREVGTFEGASKDASIEAHTGKAGQPDTKQGRFKAVVASGWAGGLEFEAPPKPLVEKKRID